MYSPTGELPRRKVAAAGDALAVTTIVAFVNFTCAAHELRRTAAQLGAVLTQKTRAFVQAVAFTASCLKADRMSASSTNQTDERIYFDFHSFAHCNLEELNKLQFQWFCGNIVILLFASPCEAVTCSSVFDINLIFHHGHRRASDSILIWSTVAVFRSF